MHDTNRFPGAMERRGRVPLLVLIPLLLASGAAGVAAAEVKVELADGRTLRGELRRIQPSLFLVQTNDQLFEITGDEAVSFDGRPEPPASAVRGDMLLRYETYDEILPNGDADSWSTTHFSNEGRTIWTFLQWRAKERELETHRNSQYFDNFGRPLSQRIEPESGTGLYNIYIDLQTPIAPGESVNLTKRVLKRGAAVKEGDLFSLAFAGDFPEDRIYLRKVKLPPGAQVVGISPEPLHRFQHDGCTIIIWRRYYPSRVAFPLKVTYRLPSAGN